MLTDLKLDLLENIGQIDMKGQITSDGFEELGKLDPL